MARASLQDLRQPLDVSLARVSQGCDAERRCRLLAFAATLRVFAGGVGVTDVRVDHQEDQTIAAWVERDVPGLQAAAVEQQRGRRFGEERHRLVHESDW